MKRHERTAAIRQLPRLHRADGVRRTPAVAAARAEGQPPAHARRACVRAEASKNPLLRARPSRCQACWPKPIRPDQLRNRPTRDSSPSRRRRAEGRAARQSARATCAPSPPRRSQPAAAGTGSSARAAAAPPATSPMSTRLPAALSGARSGASMFVLLDKARSSRTRWPASAPGKVVEVNPGGHHPVWHRAGLPDHARGKKQRQSGGHRPPGHDLPWPWPPSPSVKRRYGQEHGRHRGAQDENWPWSACWTSWKRRSSH